MPQYNKDTGLYGERNNTLYEVSMQANEYGDLVTSLDPQSIIEGKIQKHSIINKFGRNPDVDAAEDVWGGGGTYSGQPTTGLAELVTVTSSAGLTDAGLVLRIIGLDANYLPITEDVTLDAAGTTITTLAYWRLNRAYVITPATGQTTNVGSLTGAMQTTVANIFFVLPANNGQTQIAAYTIPAGYTGYIKRYGGAILDNQSNIARAYIFYREIAQAVRKLHPFVFSTATNNVQKNVYGGFMCPEKTDIRISIESLLNANADISAFFDIVLVQN